MCLIYVINVSVHANYFFGFLMWGRVPGWRLVSRVGVLGCGDLFKLFRLYIKWSLGLKHVVLEGVM